MFQFVCVHFNLKVLETQLAIRYSSMFSSSPAGVNVVAKRSEPNSLPAQIC